MKREAAKRTFCIWLLTISLLFTLSGCTDGTVNTAATKAGREAVKATEAPTKSPAEPETEAGETADAVTHTAQGDTFGNAHSAGPSSFDLTQVPAYSGMASVSVHDNQPYFTEGEYVTTPFENYSNLDGLGRCGVAYANICRELMPVEERGTIGYVRPSGWHTVKYNDIIDGNYLYNRCHLIGYQLAGENANEKNLITGTRYLNVEGMLPYENQVADYVKSTGHHVLYRVTPIFEGDNLVADGVLMEGASVEDKGRGVCFCVYVYNVQPGIQISYATGDSSRDPAYQGESALAGTTGATEAPAAEPQTGGQTRTTDYVLNTNTRKFHKPGCSTIKTMADKNKQTVQMTREEVMGQGYEPCKRCNP